MSGYKFQQDYKQQQDYDYDYPKFIFPFEPKKQQSIQSNKGFFEKNKQMFYMILVILFTISMRLFFGDNDFYPRLFNDLQQTGSSIGSVIGNAVQAFNSPS